MRLCLWLVIRIVLGGATILVEVLCLLKVPWCLSHLHEGFRYSVGCVITVGTVAFWSEFREIVFRWSFKWNAIIRVFFSDLVLLCISFFFGQWSPPYHSCLPCLLYIYFGQSLKLHHYSFLLTIKFALGWNFSCSQAKSASGHELREIRDKFVFSLRLCRCSFQSIKTAGSCSAWFPHLALFFL